VTPAAGTASTEGPPGRLAWRCRRGIKELDLLLQGWLEHGYPHASSAERALFAQFLELPDPEIAGYLLAHETPPDPCVAALVAQLAIRRV
jgi:antitoxin CptB